MSRNSSRLASVVIASVLAGVSFSAADAEDAIAKRSATVMTKSKADKRAHAKRSHRIARAAGRKVG